MSCPSRGLSFFVYLTAPGIPGAAVWRQGSGPMNPALRGCRKAWVHLGTQGRLTSGGTPLEREGLLGGGLRGGLLPLHGPLPASPAGAPSFAADARPFGARGSAGSAPPPRRGEGLTGRGRGSLGAGTEAGGALGSSPGGAELRRHQAPRAGGAGAVLRLRLPPCGLPRPAGFFFRFQINN